MLSGIMIGTTHLLAAWDRLRSTYWFVPSIMTASAIGLALLSIAVDRRAEADAPWIQWVYGGGADGARSLLSAVAGSTITVVSLTFSVTIVALTVSSQHFGPRLLANYMRDTAAQVVLGTFIGTFAFCLVVLRTVQGDGESYPRFVPHLSVTVVVGLALLSVAALIYYLHHVAASMQVSRITLNVTRDLEAAIDRLYPADGGTGTESPAQAAPELPADGAGVPARSAGYVQAIDLDAVVALAASHGTTVWLRSRPGDFVTDGSTLAAVSPAPRDAAGFAERLQAAYVVGIDRTAWQDAEFAIQQLVEVALHALSPGINEPFTAITCIDRLGQGLGRLAARPLPSAVRLDGRGEVRVVAEPRTFVSLLAAAFDPIALYAADNPAIYGRLLATLGDLGRRATRGEDRAAVREQATLTLARARRHVDGERARRALEETHDRALDGLGVSPSPDRTPA